jgi:hypothetical protein
MRVNAVSQSANLREHDFASSLTFGDSGSRKQIAASEERVANNGEEPGNRDVTPIPLYGMPAGRNGGASAVYCWRACRQAKTVQTLVCWTAR